MGRVIARLAEERNDCAVCAGVDVAVTGERYSDFPVYSKISDIKEKPDVIVDFSHPSALDSLLNYCKIQNIPVVIATTGYTEEEINKIRSASEQIPVFFTFNMSLGINLLVDLARKAVKVLGGQFDIEIIEKHHNQKKDAPSGTALMIAEALNSELDGKMKYVYDRHNVRKPRDKDEIGLHSIRGGTITGEHDIIFAGHDEVITLSHSAQSREVFAAGALNAAVFLARKPKGMYEMRDLLEE